jgi:hypothetical protein
MDKQNERLKETIYRMRDKLKITWNKTAIEESLDELNKCNGDLQHLGEQMRKINKITSERTAINVRQKQLPQEFADFGLVRRASRAFHDALANAFSARSDTWQHLPARQHNVQMFLDAKVSDSVYMDLVMVCPGHVAR